MARNNPSNPYTKEPNHTSKDVQMPIAKAKVVSVKGHPEQNGFHSARIKIYGDESTHLAPVLAPAPGSVWVPSKGTDVAVLFSQNDKPWVVGSWYALDRIEEGTVDLPAYRPGDIRMGNETGAHMTAHHDGSVSIKTPENQPVNIDHHSASMKMSADQNVSSDGTYHRIAFDTAEDDADDLFNPSDNSVTIRSDGLHDVLATVEVPDPGQNNRYTLAFFNNGTEFKRKSNQSVENDILSVDVRTTRTLSNGDVIDVRLKQDSGSAKTINSDFAATEFSIERHGI